MDNGSDHLETSVTPMSSTDHRWYHTTPDRLVLLLLAVEGFLFLADWFHLLPKGYAVLIAVASVGLFLLLMLIWFAAASVFQWRFQFGIRSLLVLTVVVAIPSSWMAVEMERAKRQKEALAAIEEAGGSVGYEFYTPPSGGNPRGPAWLRTPLGNDFFNDPVGASLIDDTEMERLKDLPQLQLLLLDHSRITDAGLASLAELSELQSLLLDKTPITDAGLEHLAGLSQLQSLSLDNTRVTDVGLVHLARLSQLRTLWLKNIKVTDSGGRTPYHPAMPGPPLLGSWATTGKAAT
jgi:hypothetical protein